MTLRLASCRQIALWCQRSRVPFETFRHYVQGLATDNQPEGFHVAERAMAQRLVQSRPARFGWANEVEIGANALRVRVVGSVLLMAVEDGEDNLPTIVTGADGEPVRRPGRAEYDGPGRLVTFQEAGDFIRAGERVIPHMYRDPDNNVTVGVGSQLETVQEAMGLAFIHEDDGTPATTEEIANEYNDLPRQDGGNRTADSYDADTELELPDGEIERVFERDFDDHLDTAE